MNTDTTKVTEQASDGCSGIPEGSYPPGYSRRDIQEQGVNLEDYVRIYEDPYRGQQQYLPYQFRLAWLRNTYPQGIIRQLEPEMLAEGRQLIGGMEFFRNPEDTIGERVYCQVSRDETGPELDTRDLFRSPQAETDQCSDNRPWLQFAGSFHKRTAGSAEAA